MSVFAVRVNMFVLAPVMILMRAKRVASPRSGARLFPVRSFRSWSNSSSRNVMATCYALSSVSINNISMYRYRILAMMHGYCGLESRLNLLPSFGRSLVAVSSGGFWYSTGN